MIYVLCVWEIVAYMVNVCVLTPTVNSYIEDKNECLAIKSFNQITIPIANLESMANYLPSSMTLQIVKDNLNGNNIDYILNILEYKEFWNVVLIENSSLSDLKHLSDEVRKITHRFDYCLPVKKVAISDHFNLERIGMFVSYIKHLKEMTFEEIVNKNEISFEFISKFQNLKKIHVIRSELNSLQWVQLMNSLPDSILELNFSGSNYTGNSAQNFLRFTELETINLALCCHIDEKNWTEILSFLNGDTIQKVDFSMSSFSGMGLKLFNRLYRLKVLKLHNTRNIPQENWGDLLRLLSRDLQILDLSWTTFSGSCLECLQYFEKLEELDLSACPDISEDSLVVLLEHLPSSVKIVDLGLTVISRQNTKHKLAVIRALKMLNEKSGIQIIT